MLVKLVAQYCFFGSAAEPASEPINNAPAASAPVTAVPPFLAFHVGNFASNRNESRAHLRLPWSCGRIVQLGYGAE